MKFILLALSILTVSNSFASDIECINKILEPKCYTVAGGRPTDYSASSKCKQSVSYRTSTGNIRTLTFSGTGGAMISDAEKGAAGMTLMLGYPVVMAKVRARAENIAKNYIESEMNYLNAYPSCSDIE